MSDGAAWVRQRCSGWLAGQPAAGSSSSAAILTLKRRSAHCPLPCVCSPPCFCCPQVFSEVHFGNHFALEGASRKKSEICRCAGRVGGPCDAQLCMHYVF